MNIDGVTFDEVVEHLVHAIEAVGITILVIGAAIAFVNWMLDLRHRERRDTAYPLLRRRLARVILLGLEVLLLADIILTIVVEPSLDSVFILAMIVVIRIVLSFSLEVEIEGVWPWSRWRTGSGSDLRGQLSD